jgi:hypothetical protein
MVWTLYLAVSHQLVVALVLWVHWLLVQAAMAALAGAAHF